MPPSAAKTGPLIIYNKRPGFDIDHAPVVQRPEINRNPADKMYWLEYILCAG